MEIKHLLPAVYFGAFGADLCLPGPCVQICLREMEGGHIRNEAAL